MDAATDFDVPRVPGVVCAEGICEVADYRCTFPEIEVAVGNRWDLLEWVYSSEVRRLVFQAWQVYEVESEWNIRALAEKDYRTAWGGVWVGV